MGVALPNSVDGFGFALGAEAKQEPGKKFDAGKPRLDLLPYSGLTMAAEVLEYGRKKYGKNNWACGMSWSRPYAACLRHLMAWNNGENIDPESGLHHIGHALCNLLFLATFISEPEGYAGFDDRFQDVAQSTIVHDDENVTVYHRGVGDFTVTPKPGHEFKPGTQIAVKPVLVTPETPVTASEIQAAAHGIVMTADPAKQWADFLVYGVEKQCSYTCRGCGVFQKDTPTLIKHLNQNPTHLMSGVIAVPKEETEGCADNP